ncbi:MAG TPA: ParB/Srx family N-terminal domain-containing protein [Clostridia bacterium]|nr:ParB/Srx family N-terminal domain-containing protein [Clostridia bacterium]
MKSEYREIRVSEIMLDYENPRIAKYLEIYGEGQISSETISMALGAGTDEKSGPSYSSLKESIKANQGIIHPIIVNELDNGKLVVIEGNTRVQIYKEFYQAGVPGEWETISSIVYKDLADEEIHAIRLQSHLVGPRDWDPYSKAKYLNYLSNKEKLPILQIISFCGGKSAEVKKMIDAYYDIENYYRSNLDDDSEFDQREFSKFMELQNRGIKDAIVIHKYDRNDFAKWVIDGNIDTAQNVRKIPVILKSKEATKVFLEENISEAMKVLAIEEFDAGPIKDVSYGILASELTKKLRNIKYAEIRSLRFDPDYDDKKAILFDLLDELMAVAEEIKEE